MTEKKERKNVLYNDEFIMNTNTVLFFFYIYISILSALDVFLLWHWVRDKQCYCQCESFSAPVCSVVVYHLGIHSQVDSCLLKWALYYSQLLFCSSCFRMSFYTNGQAVMGHAKAIVLATYVTLVPVSLVLIEVLHS